jgi:hypothetical protein
LEFVLEAGRGAFLKGTQVYGDLAIHGCSLAMVCMKESWRLRGKTGCHIYYIVSWCALDVVERGFYRVTCDFCYFRLKEAKEPLDACPEVLTLLYSLKALSNILVIRLARLILR